ncbi:death-associated protein kinase 1-like isoform X2 [Oscarella lobularis]|uniref:death-associated protein kinase 1-like isoform X2 n=1 Tax=Oscarella lobularis TaxID=121494 RepID=UPI0033135397
MSQTYEADETLLLSALEKNRIDFAKLLIDSGANVNQSNEFGEFPLGTVCDRGNVELARILINAGANVDDSSNDTRCLIKACQKGCFEIAQLLIDAGANVNEHWLDYSAPLLEACSKGHVGIVKLLLAKGADVNWKDYHQAWPLQIACSRCNIELAKVLVDAGADVNQTNKRGQSVLHFLARSYSWRDTDQHSDLVTFILRSSPSLIDIPDENRCLPHEIAPTSQALFEAWTSYRYSKLYSHGTTKPTKIKVCVVGKERAGKTTLIKTLQNIDWREGGDDVRTASMDVTAATVDSAGELVFCDFAGQPFFYKTHGLFFSETTTMFLLVVDSTQSCDQLRESSHFILSFVKCSGAFTEKANVLVLGSKKDLLSDLKCGEVRFRRLFRYLKITFGAWFNFQENYFLLNCRDRSSNQLGLLRKAIGVAKEKTIETSSDVPIIVDAAVSSFLPTLRNPSDTSAVPQKICYSFSNESAESIREKCLALLKSRGLLTPEKENRCMDSDVFRQIMVASIYPGLTEQVQRLLVEFLQGIGEIFVMEDKIILELSWLCHSVLGPLLSPDEFQITLSCSPPGTTTKEKIQRALEAFNNQKWDNIDETLSLLCSLEICFELSDRPNAYQFPALIQQERPPEIWCINALMTVYVGRRWKREDETDIITPGTMPFLQCHVRNTECFCGLEPVLWQGGLMIKKRIDEFSLEGMVILQDVDKALDFVVRGPEHSEGECIKLLKDLMSTGEKVLQEKSPGMERDLWYISSSELKELKESPVAYRKETVEKILALRKMKLEGTLLPTPCFTYRPLTW